jgi:hypothetical protein
MKHLMTRASCVLAYKDSFQLLSVALHRPATCRCRPRPAAADSQSVLLYAFPTFDPTDPLIPVCRINWHKNRRALQIQIQRAKEGRSERNAVHHTAVMFAFGSLRFHRRSVDLIPTLARPLRDFSPPDEESSVC